MNLVDCYRVLGLASGASFPEVKASYRRLARLYHPDVSTGDRQTKDKFIEITAAYKFLQNSLAEGATIRRSPNPATTAPAPAKPSASQSRRKVQLQSNPVLSPLEQQLKASSYQQLQQLLRSQKLPRAIALVEGLARRLPCDPEVIQWQAIVYQQWGRQLIRDKQIDKARLYLKKALRTDPHNRSLWAEVEKDFRSIEQLSS